MALFYRLILGVSLILTMDAKAQPALVASARVQRKPPERAIYFGSAEGYGQRIESELDLPSAKWTAIMNASNHLQERMPSNGKLIPQAVLAHLEFNEIHLNTGRPYIIKVSTKLKQLIFSEQQSAQTYSKLGSLVFRGVWNGQVTIEKSISPDEIVLSRISASELNFQLKPETTEKIRKALEEISISPATITAELGAIPDGYDYTTASVPLTLEATRDFIKVSRGDRVRAAIQNCLAYLMN